MSWWWPFSQKKRYEGIHRFNDDERELSLELRRQKAEFSKKKNELDLELQRLEFEKRKAQLDADILEAKERVAEFYDDDAEPTDDKTDALLTVLLSKILTPAPVAASPSPPTSTMQSSLSDEQLREIIAQVPKQYLKAAKKMPEDTLKGIISARLPGLDTETMNRAVGMIKSY